MNRKMLAYVLLFLAFLVGLHQFLNWGVWFQISDVHHELFESALAFAGIVLLVTEEHRNV
jgi:hypothetical protein